MSIMYRHAVLVRGPPAGLLLQRRTVPIADGRALPALYRQHAPLGAVALRVQGSPGTGSVFGRPCAHGGARAMAARTNPAAFASRVGHPEFPVLSQSSKYSAPAWTPGARGGSRYLRRWVSSRPMGRSSVSSSAPIRSYCCRGTRTVSRRHAAPNVSHRATRSGTRLAAFRNASACSSTLYATAEYVGAQYSSRTVRVRGLCRCRCRSPRLDDRERPCQ